MIIIVPYKIYHIAWTDDTRNLSVQYTLLDGTMARFAYVVLVQVTFLGFLNYLVLEPLGYGHHLSF